MDVRATAERILTTTNETAPSAALLLLRLWFGGVMLAAHGWGKLAGFAERADRFPDPLGLGSPALSLGLAVFAEFFCALAVMAGLATRLAAIPLMTTMAVAALIVHADDPWSKQEFGLLYMFAFAALMIAGAGRFSADAVLARRLGAGDGA